MRPGEAAVAAPAALYAALAVGATTLADLASNALYVAAFPPGALGRFYVLASAGRVAVAFAYATLGQRRGRGRLDGAVVAAVGLLMAAAAVAAPGLGPGALSFASLALLTAPQLLPLIGFQAAVDCLHARQAKRLLPLLAAAATAGTVLASAAARALARGPGTPWLLGLGALLCAAALPLPGLLHRRAAAGEAAPATAPAPAKGGTARGFVRTLFEAFDDLRASSAARVVAAYALLGALAQNLTDFAWKSTLKAEGGGPDGVAAALSTFSMYANALTLAAQLALAGGLAARLGVRGALALSPLALCALAPVFALAPGVATAAALKGAEVVGRYGVGTAAADLLLTPLPAASRLRTKVLVKGAAGPAGLALAGALVGLGGPRGLAPAVTGALVALAGALGLWVARRARRAYADALAGALGKGRQLTDVSAHSAALLRRQMKGRLARAIAAGDEGAAIAVLAVLDGHLFTLGDLAPALASPRPPVRRAGLEAARRLLHPGEGGALLARFAPDPDPELEAAALALARRAGGPAGPARAAGARAAAERDASDPRLARLWAEAWLAETALEGGRDRAAKALRTAALKAAAPRRAQALWALGELGEARGEPEIMRALGDDDPDVFSAAARAAVRVGARGAVPTLAARLAAGPHAAAAARALALAGPAAADDLLALLPVTRGERGLAPTAVATGGRTIGGTVRAARALAGLGPEACERVLRRYTRLGFRARSAVCRALAHVPEKTGRAVDRAAVLEAMEFTVAYAEGLARARPAAVPGGLLEGELIRRIDETSARLLDLASLVGDRDRIGQARAALGGAARRRGHALELLEQLLPPGLGRRTLDLLDPPPPGEGRAPGAAPPRLDGWLGKCSRFDRNELPSADPMVPVLERVLVLRESPLFAGLSGEELYPAAEIAQPAAYGAGSEVVREGDPGDALYVVAGGAFEVRRGGRLLRALGRGGVFGEMSLLDGAPRAASVVAGPGARALRVPREEFEALLDESPELARGVIRTLVGHLRGGAP